MLTIHNGRFRGWPCSLMELLIWLMNILFFKVLPLKMAMLGPHFQNPRYANTTVFFNSMKQNTTYINIFFYNNCFYVQLLFFLSFHVQHLNKAQQLNIFINIETFDIFSRKKQIKDLNINSVYLFLACLSRHFKK